MIDTNERQRLLSELARDSSKDFDSELKRTLRLQQDVLRDYGFEGIQLILKIEDGLDAVALENTPEYCPWAVGRVDGFHQYPVAIDKVP